MELKLSINTNVLVIAFIITSIFVLVLYKLTNVDYFVNDSTIDFTLPISYDKVNETIFLFKGITIFDNRNIDLAF